MYTEICSLLRYSSTGLTYPYWIVVYDLKGIKVFQQDSFTDSVLNLSHLPKGVYILKIATAKDRISKRVYFPDIIDFLYSEIRIFLYLCITNQTNTRK